MTKSTASLTAKSNTTVGERYENEQTSDLRLEVVYFQVEEGRTRGLRRNAVTGSSLRGVHFFCVFSSKYALPYREARTVHASFSFNSITCMKEEYELVKLINEKHL